MRLFFVKALVQTHLFSSQIHMSTHAPRVYLMRLSNTHAEKKGGRERERERTLDTRAHALSLHFTIQYIDRKQLFFLALFLSSALSSYMRIVYCVFRSCSQFIYLLCHSHSHSHSVVTVSTEYRIVFEFILEQIRKYSW